MRIQIMSVGETVRASLLLTSGVSHPPRSRTNTPHTQTNKQTNKFFTQYLYY